jgi:peptide/nickel transport system permease protein
MLRSRGGWVWLARRLGLSVVVLLVVSILIFAATQALPSDPATAILGKDASPERVAALRAQLGLDQPLVAQYTGWLMGVLRGDFGVSLASGFKVSEMLGGRIANSLTLLFLVMAVGLPLSFALGTATAVRRDGIMDKTVLIVSLSLVALPEFVIGVGLILLFATTVLRWLPAVSILPPGDSPLAHLDALVLPAVTLVLVVAPYLYRLVRASMIDVLESEYIAMARLKGMSERIVWRRHAVPNALVPAIQGTALVGSYLIGGIVVVEFLFGFPGLGSALTSAIAARDIPVIQATTLIFALGVAIFNLLADILTVYVTPRLRTGGGLR